MSSQHSIHTAQSAQKSTVTNQKWLGPDLGECEAAFVAAFVERPPAIPQSWYTIKTPDFTARVDRESGEITYSDEEPKV